MTLRRPLTAIYLLLVVEVTIVTTLKPQGVHNFRIQSNHKCQRKKEHHIPRGGISPSHPIFWEYIHAEIAALRLHNVFDYEHRGNKYYGEDPTGKNNHLKL